MGTNYYLRKKEPTIHETIHIAKQSWGWRTSWQHTDERDWPRWCDDDPCVVSEDDGIIVYGPVLPWPIDSVDDIRRYLENGEWEIVDEYGDVAEPDVIDKLERWDGGKSNYNADNPDKPVTWVPKSQGDYRDARGNNFTRDGFC